MSSFPMLVTCLSDCMATRHLEPGGAGGWAGGGEAGALWRTAATAFNAVVQSGLPSINISSHNNPAQVGVQVRLA